MANVDWDLILETIRAERCIILLGPEFATLESGRTWEEALIDHLDPEGNQGLKYYPDDGLLHFKDPILRTRTYFKVKAFYREIAEAARPPQYEMLARIPFHLFISTSPDAFLGQTGKDEPAIDPYGAHGFHAFYILCLV